MNDVEHLFICFISLYLPPPFSVLYITPYFVCFLDFLMWTIFKVFIGFVTILLLFRVLIFWLLGMWDFSSLTRD